MLGVVGFLKGPPPLRFVDGVVHALGDPVGVEDHAGVDVAGGAADRLHQRGFAAEKALLVGVENGDESDLRQVEAFPQQVDADQHVKHALAETPQQLYPLKGVELAVQPAAADVAFGEVGREVFGELLGERGHQHTMAVGDRAVDLRVQVRDLLPGRLDLDPRVEQACRTDDLLNHLAAGLAQLPVAGRGRDVDRLMQPLLKLVKHQRPVVEGAGQPEAVVDERQLAAAVAGIHPANLRHRDVRLVDKKQKVVGEVVEERVGGAAGGAAGERPGVVFDSGAEAGFGEHLDVEAGASRWASSSLPWLLNSSSRSSSSWRMLPTARLMRSSGITKCRDG